MGCDVAGALILVVIWINIKTWAFWGVRGEGIVKSCLGPLVLD